MITFTAPRRRIALGVACLAATTGIVLAAPTALGQSAPFNQATQLGQATQFNPFQTDPRLLCPGRAEPKGTAAFLRTELYFGSNKPDGTAVTPDQFQQFLNDVITPRFPDGLTVLTGVGQFKGSNGVTERERSMELILLYPVDTARSSGQKIEQIRAAYEQMFQQESVLRADAPLPECVSF